MRRDERIKKKAKVIQIAFDEKQEQVYLKLKALAVEQKKTIGEVLVEAMRCLLEKHNRGGNGK